MNPLVDALPEEVPLPRAPLVRVLCQLRFPAVLSVESKEFVAPFQEEMRGAYPVLRPEETAGFILGPAGMVPSKPETAWRFHDLANEWRVSLTPNFIALETTKYPSRKEFLERLRAVVVAAERHIHPAVIDRIGLRYLDRVSGSAMQRLPELIRPEVLGVIGSKMAESAGQSVTESLFDADRAMMMARWGKIPQGATMDPNFMAPIETPSWILDLDMFSKPGVNTRFDPDEVIAAVQAYAERIYAVFRWCVTKEFLKYYGGKP